ncbi:MAG TPA: imidazole glycerol phosphate synthase subunit HisH [Rudaea sp.]
MRDVVLVDGGGTNIGSVRFALERLGVAAELTRDARRIAAATHIILPGVGAAGPGMARLREAGLVDVLRNATQPLLGVCLGMQLLYDHSEEGDTECLGVLPGRVRKIEPRSGLRVPHMGWNRLNRRRDDALIAGLHADAHAYFVHSYAAPVTADTLAASDHAGEFASVVRRANRCGMQFHPERSAAVGARLLANFLAL